ncbi:MAG: hypothetical protein AAF170_13775 [Bacteroidota bacterium]
MADSHAADSSPSPPSEDQGFTLDLSTGKAPSRRKRKRKGPAPVVQQTINLSTPKSEKPPEPDASSSTSPGTSKAPGKPTRKRRKERPAPRSGNSLADLLDAETLARLRGE